MTDLTARATVNKKYRQVATVLGERTVVCNVLTEYGSWLMLRRADAPNAMPFVKSIRSCVAMGEQS